MAETLDYFTPASRDARDPSPPGQRDARAAAIPIEFDALLTQTADHAAARAVEAELGRQGIAFFRIEGGSHTNRAIELHVRSADHATAAQFAAMIFARRQRLDAIAPRPKPPPDSTLTGGGVDGFVDV